MRRPRGRPSTRSTSATSERACVEVLRDPSVPRTAKPAARRRMHRSTGSAGHWARCPRRASTRACRARSRCPCRRPVIRSVSEAERIGVRHPLAVRRVASGVTARVWSNQMYSSNCSGQHGLEVVALQFGLGTVDHADRALEPRTATAPRAPPPKRACCSGSRNFGSPLIVEQPLVAAARATGARS